LNNLHYLIVRFFDSPVRVDVFRHRDWYIAALKSYSLLCLAASCFLCPPLRPVKALDFIGGAKLIEVLGDCPLTIPA
jgi:hypothetical protein